MTYLSKVALRSVFFLISWYRCSFLSVAPEPLAIWNKELEGLELSVALVALEPLAVWHKELDGLLLKLLRFFIEGLLSIYPSSLSKRARI